MPYAFSQIYSRYKQEICNPKLVSDLDFSKDPAMTWQRYLAYSLYPIDIRKIRSDSYNSLIFFSKKDAAAYVSADFEIIHKIDY